MKFASIFDRRVFVLGAWILALSLGAMLTLQPAPPAQASGAPQQVRLTPTEAAPAPSASPSVSVGTIALSFSGAPASAWVTVEWQDGYGVWHRVDGWQDKLGDTGLKTWWVNEAQLGTSGLYRWVVYDQRGGNLWATSSAFHLPSAAGKWVTVTLSAASATATPTATSFPPTRPDTYTVQRGDNLFRIALRFQTTVSALQTRNGLTGLLIHPGQVLIIPGSYPESVAASPSPTAPLRTDPIPPGIYVVQPHDNIYRIALRAGTTIAALQSVNHLEGTQIQIGQELIIP